MTNTNYVFFLGGKDLEMATIQQLLDSKGIEYVAKDLGWGNAKTSSYEAEINIAIHSDGGTVTFEIDDEGIIHLSFDDIGPGIEDIELALTPGYSTASPKARELGFGAGMGLYNMQSVASTFEITSSKEGTHIKMTFK